jgi:endonuclease YncB( thermonuclease family)
MRHLILTLIPVLLLLGCSQSRANEDSSQTSLTAASYSSIYWSDGDSGRLGKLKFRLANIDAPETGSMKQRGGAKCESERAIGYDAKAFIVEFTKDKTITIVRDYGEDRYGRLVVDLEADGADVAKAGVDAGHLRDWLHIKGRAQSPKPDWCASSSN